MGSRSVLCYSDRDLVHSYVGYSAQVPALSPLKGGHASGSLINHTSYSPPSLPSPLWGLNLSHLNFEEQITSNLQKRGGEAVLSSPLPVTLPLTIPTSPSLDVHCGAFLNCMAHTHLVNSETIMEVPETP